MRALFLTYISFAISASGHIWDGKDYHQNSLSQAHAAQRLMQNYDFNTKASLLDVGCGDGKITASLAQKLSGDVVGIDISQSMIDFAAHTFTQPNLAFVKGDAAKLEHCPDLEGRFDYVTSFSALQWVPDQLAALKGMYRALKPNGRVLITTPKHYPECLSNALLDVISEPEYNQAFHGFQSGQRFYGVAEYTALMQNAGFIEVRVRHIQSHDRFASLDAFKNFVKQWLPWAQVFADPSVKDAFMTRLMERYAAFCPPGADGSVVFLKDQLEATALKGDVKSEL